MAQERIFTIDGIYDLPDGKRAELIDGQIYFKAMPDRKHQEIVRMLIQRIANYIDHKGRPCEVYPAPFAVFLNEDDINYVEPDVSVICDPSKFNDKVGYLTAEHFVEIKCEKTYYNCRCAESWKKHNFSNHIKKFWIPTYKHGLNNRRY